MPNNNNIQDNQDIISYQYLQNLTMSFTPMSREEIESGRDIKRPVNTSQRNFAIDNTHLSSPINIRDIHTEFEQNLINSILSSNARPIDFMHNISFNIPKIGIKHKNIILCPYTSENEFECPITLKMHKEGFILPCKHIFSNEILKWTKNTCPCCRSKF